MSIWPNGNFPHAGTLAGQLNAITHAFTGNVLFNEEGESAPTPPKLPAELRSAIDGLRFRHEVGHADATPILAYRGWADQGGRLTSIGIGTVAWPTRRRFEAVCHRGAGAGTYFSGPGGGGGGLPAHNAPHQDCTCGVYGFATPASLEQVFTSAVLGRVSLGGEVVVCADRNVGDHGGAELGPILGYRAQSAYPSLLYTWTAETKGRGNSGDLRRINDGIKRLAQAYGVETAPLPDEVLTQMERTRERAAELRKRADAVSTQQAYAAQQAYLNQVYGASMQQLGAGQQQAGIAVGNGTGGVTINGGTWALPAGGGPGGGPAGPSVYGGIVPSLAQMLGIEIATPSTVALHDHLTNVARQQGLVE